MPPDQFRLALRAASNRQIPVRLIETRDYAPGSTFITTRGAFPQRA